MKQEFHETRDISLFKTKSVEELCLLWNLSIGYLRRFKKKYYPELIRKRNKIDKNLLEERLKNYLTSISSKKKSVNLSYFCNVFDYPNSFVSSYLSKLIADKYEISVNFTERNKYEHSYSVYYRGLCKCNICKLCNAIFTRCKNRKQHVSNNRVSELAYKYGELYEADASQYKKIFYKQIDKELKERVE